MKFDICLPCFYRELPFHEGMRKIREAGFDAVESWGIDESFDPERINAVSAETGVRYLSLVPNAFSVTEPSKQADWLDELRRCCDFAKKVGLHQFISQVGPDTGESREVQRRRIVESLKKAVPIVSEAEVCLLIEPLNHYDHPGYYLTRSEEAAEIVREVNDPHIGMIFDIYHQQIMEGDIVRRLEKCLDVTKHIHIAGVPKRDEPWHGENDYSFIFSKIMEMGYDGYVGLEYFPELESAESLREFRERYRDFM